MKIEKLQTFVVGNPPPRTGGRYFIFVKLTTDTGVTGIGEIYSVLIHFTLKKCGDVLMARVSRIDQTSAPLV